ncbi:hypothetical protein VoSk93_35440 [Vibrio owensii]
MAKPRYKTTNWKHYNQALINRGSLTFWIDEEAVQPWKQIKRAKTVNVAFKTKTKGTIQYLAIDATGLKVYGEGEWKVKSMVLTASAVSGVSYI